MCRMISCLVDRRGKVYAADGVHSHSAIAEAHGISQDDCLAYEYHLDKPVSQRLYQDFTIDGAHFKAMASHDQAALNFFHDCASTPERLIAFVLRGNWSDELPGLLTPEALVLYRKTIAEAVARYDKTYAEVRAIYSRTYDKALALYNKTCIDAWTLYSKKTCTKAEVLRDKTCDEAFALYEKTRDEAGALHVKTCDEASALYGKIRDEAWGKFFKDPKNRIPAWRL